MLSITYWIDFCLLIIITLIHHVHHHPQLRSYYEMSYRGYYIEMFIGQPPQLCVMSLDFSFPFTRIGNILYSYTRSMTHSLLSISPSLLNNTDVKGIEIEDIVRIGDDKHDISSQLTFININNSNNFITPNAIGLSYQFINSNYSIIHQLKAQGFINQLSFALVAINKQWGSLYYGGIPLNMNINKTVSYCNVKGRNGLWDCNISKILIKGHRYSNKESAYATFDSHLRNIEAPIEFEKFLITNYFKKAQVNHQTNYDKRSPNEKQFSCSLFDIDKLPNITFVIDNYSYSLNSEMLFSCSSKECTFTITINTERKNWLFGLVFLRKFDLLFNYEDSKIYFYSDKTDNMINEYIETNKESNQTSILYYLLLISIIDLIGGVTLILASKKFLL